MTPNKRFFTWLVSSVVSCQLENALKSTWTLLVVVFMLLSRGLKIKFLENYFFLENYITSEGAVSHNGLYYQPLPITRVYQERFYANNYFE